MLDVVDELSTVVVLNTAVERTVVGAVVELNALVEVMGDEANAILVLELNTVVK